MPPSMTNDAPTPEGASQLDRIEAKLDRLQANYDQLSPLLDQVPDLVATLGNTVDDLAAREGRAKFDARVRRSLALLLRLSEPEVAGAIERLLDTDALELMAATIVELPKAADAPEEHHGLVGLLGVLGEDEVQRALSLFIHFTRRFGRMLGERDRGELS